MVENEKDKTNLLAQKVNNKLCSIEQAVKYENPLMTDEERALEVARIKSQNMIDMTDEEIELIGLTNMEG